MLNNHKPQCTAKSKHTGEQCRNNAMDGRNVCRMHGGKTPRGIASPHYQGKGFSKHLPTRFKEIFDNIEDDLEHNLLSRNIKAREMFIREKLEKLDNAPDSEKAWNELRALVDDIKKAYADTNDGAMAKALDKTNRLIDKQILYHLAASEIRQDLNQQREDKKAIAAIEFKGENAATMKEIQLLIGFMVRAILENVSNPREQGVLIGKLESLTIDSGSNQIGIEQLSASVESAWPY